MKDFRFKYGFKKSKNDSLKWYRKESSEGYTQVF